MVFTKRLIPLALLIPSGPEFYRFIVIEHNLLSICCLLSLSEWISGVKADDSGFVWSIRVSSSVSVFASYFSFTYRCIAFVVLCGLVKVV